ncbi:MAG: hypothetical protein LC803_15555 [Acidobacteria bacterium]|nr:hypothetical protein [Acidobacteriota bacterium]
MPSPKIPKRFLIGLINALSLPENSFQELVTKLERVPLTLNVRELLGEVVSDVSGIAPDDAEKIASALMSLYMVRANSDRETSEAIDDIADTLEDVEDRETSLTDEVLSNLKPRLAKLLEVNSFVVGTKAISMLQEHDNIFYRARVLTDIRPVFGVAPDAVQAAVIVHNLMIHHHQGENHKDFYVTLDTQDVQILIDILERAKVKAESLKSLLATSNIPYIEPE